LFFLQTFVADCNRTRSCESSYFEDVILKQNKKKKWKFVVVHAQFREAPESATTARNDHRFLPQKLAGSLNAQTLPQQRNIG